MRLIGVSSEKGMITQIPHSGAPLPALPHYLVSLMRVKTRFSLELPHWTLLQNKIFLAGRGSREKGTILMHNGSRRTWGYKIHKPKVKIKTKRN